MEYRNSGEATHFGKGVAAGVEGTAGSMLTSNALQAIGDATDVDLYLKPKGAGKLYLGSTTALSIVTGQSTTTIPNMPGASQDVSTFAAAGLSTGDILFAVDARGAVSTHVAMGGFTVASANKARVTWINVHASSIAAESTGITLRWAYLDRT